MDSLPIKIITEEIFRWLFSIDKQIIRRINKKFNKLTPYEQIEFNKTSIKLVHLIRYKKLWSNYTTANITKNGDLDCTRQRRLNFVGQVYAHNNGCHWGKYTTQNAAQNGYLDCLKYAHEHGCHWDTYTTAYAAKGGHLDCTESVRS